MQSKEEELEEGKTIGRRGFLRRTAIGAGAMAITAIASGCGASQVADVPAATSTVPSAQAWKFGIMSDSQWYQPDTDKKNPYSVAIDIINQVNEQMINNGVKFVIQVGDLTANGQGTPQDVAGRALFAQALYNAGIGFFPIRGNHEDSAGAATVFQTSFPQTQTGVHNNSPASVLGLSNQDSATQPTPTNTLGKTFSLGTNISSPTPWGNDLAGLSYSFDYNNARFILLDQFTPADTPSGYNINTSIASQQSWVTGQLSGRATGSHAFMVTHKGLVLPYHTDVLLGSNPSQNPTATDEFITEMAKNGARYLLCGHDHMHDHCIVPTTDGKTASVHQLVTSSNSCYNYFPRNPNVVSSDKVNDSYNVDAFGISRRAVINQDLNAFGYYIVTVDGQNVTFEHYSAPSYATFDLGQHQWDLTTTPPLNFTLRDTFGYSQVGQEFTIPFGGLFTSVKDTSPNGTIAKVLSGSNMSQAQDYGGSPMVRSVSTGWATGSGHLKSDILYLWGIQSGLASEQSETYALQISYKSGVFASQLKAGTVGIAVVDDSGAWSNAVKANFGGTRNFVSGPWQSGYGLGTYGVDTANGVAWAVINYAGTFAVSTSI